jgi:uncharacterized protein involved in exopolysaccharide biosynthesis
MLDQMNLDSPPIRTPVDDAELRGPLSATTVLRILLRVRKRILVVTVITFGLSALLAFFLPVSYTATASFIPPGANADSSAAALMGQIASFGGAGGLLEGKSKAELYLAILKSQTIAREMVGRFDLMHVYGIKKESKAERKLASKSLFTVGTKNPVITIEVTDHSAQRARDLAQGYLDLLQQTEASLALTESSQRRLFFEQRLAHEKDDLANAEVEQKKVEEQTGLVAPAGQTATNIQALAQVQAQITTDQAQLASLLHDETEQNPEVLRLRSEIGSLQAKAAQMESGTDKGFGRLSTAQVPELQLEYIRKEREVKYHEALFDIISKQYEAARLDEAKDAPLQVLDRPVLPDTKSGPPRAIIMAVGLLIGLLGSSAWALLGRGL